MREIAVVFDPERKLFLYLGLLLLAIVLGPYGTYAALELWPRITFWSLDILGSAIIMSWILHVFFNSRITAAISAPLRFFLGIAIGAVPAAAFVAMICETVGASLHLNLPLPVVYFQIVVMALSVFTVEFVVWPLFLPARAKPHARAPTGPQAAPPAPGNSPTAPNQLIAHPFFDRLPGELRGGRLVSISMQDHYAHIVTTRGEHLMLMRLRDAMDLVSDIPGAQIHRSHWAAAGMARSLERDGRRHVLVMNDNRRLPVSATYLAAARAMIDSTPATLAAAQ